MEISPILIVVIFIVAMAFIVLLAFVTENWRNTRATKGKMIAEIWEPNGFPMRHLVDMAADGKAIEFEHGVYELTRDLTEEQIKAGEAQSYPSRRFTTWGRLPLGKVTIRIESWYKDDPNPIRPPHEKPVVTALEYAARTRSIQASAIAMRIQENEARQRELEKTIRNQPSKIVVYIGLGACILVGIVAIFMIVQANGLLSAIAPYFGITP